MHYLISSNVKYYPKTYLPLVNSLLDAGISPDKITMVVGDCPEQTYELENRLNINLVPVPYNSFDMTALIYVSDNLHKFSDDYFFLMHDTCLVGPNFKVAVENYDSSLKIKTSINGLSRNIGTYSKQCIIEQTDYLNGMKCYPKTPQELQKVKEMFVVLEDAVFKRYPNCYSNFYSDQRLITIEELRNAFPDTKYQRHLRTLDTSEIPRVFAYLFEMDLYKFQANNGWHGAWKIGI